VADVIALAIDPSDHEVIYAGTKEGGLLWSEDAGASWRQPRDPALRQGAVRSVAVDPKDICTIYATVGTRLYRSLTCGRTFQSTYEETRQNVVPRRVAVDWYNTETVYLGLSNGNLLKSSDHGMFWTNIFSGKNKAINDLLVSQADSRILLMGTEQGVYRSMDSGLNWQNLSEALKAYKDGDTVYAFAQDAKGETIVAATKYGLLRSKDFGETWEALKLVTAPGQVTIRTVVLHPGRPETIFYATASTLYKSEDGGVTWKTRKIPTKRVAAVLRMDPKQPEVLYLGALTIEK